MYTQNSVCQQSSVTLTHFVLVRLTHLSFRSVHIKIRDISYMSQNQLLGSCVLIPPPPPQLNADRRLLSRNDLKQLLSRWFTHSLHHLLSLFSFLSFISALSPGAMQHLRYLPPSLSHSLTTAQRVAKPGKYRQGAPVTARESVNAQTPRAGGQ